MSETVAFGAGVLTGLFGLYAVWGWLFVLAFVVFVVAEVAFLEYENGLGATITLLIAVALAMFAQDVSWGVLLAQWPKVFWLVVAYFAMGALWSVVKWYFYTLKIRTVYDEIRQKYAKPGEAISASKKSDFQSAVERAVYGYSSSRSIPPDPQEHSSTIIMWIGHWPFSMLWTLIHDPVRRAVRFIYERLKGLYYAIAGRAFEGTADDLKGRD
jgi:hypothetical protein